MKTIFCEQGSDEWHNARRCIITGTKLESVMGTPLARVQLISKLIGEEITERSKEVKQTQEMAWGNEQEPVAIEAFTKQTGIEVDRSVGLMVSDEFDWLGFSPDGVVNGGKEMVEVKNPDTHTNVFYRLTNEIGMEELSLGTWSKPTKVNPESIFSPSSKEPFVGVPADYKYQVLQGFFVNEICERIHFLIHDDRIIEKDKKLYIVIVERSNPLVQEALKEVRSELVKFRADWVKWRDELFPSNF